MSAAELRDRTFALAEKATAKLYQLYIIPTERLRIANAAAHIGHNIFLSDYLPQNLSMREVNVVIGREVGHLQLRHIRRRMTPGFVTILAMTFAGVGSEALLLRDFPPGPALYAVVLLAI